MDQLSRSNLDISLDQSLALHGSVNSIARDSAGTESVTSLSLSELPSPTFTKHDMDVWVLARAKAQLMVIDDSTGLWITKKDSPVVSATITKQAVIIKDESAEQETSTTREFQYFITAQKITDQKELFRDELKPDTKYTPADMTFHHWMRGESRHGLAFHHIKDGKKFRMIMNKILQEMNPDLPEQISVIPSPLSDMPVLADSHSQPPARPHKPQSLYQDMEKRQSPKLAEQSHHSTPFHTNMPEANIVQRVHPLTSDNLRSNPGSKYSDYRNDCFARNTAVEQCSSVKPSDIILKTSPDSSLDLQKPIQTPMKKKRKNRLLCCCQQKDE